MKLPKGEETLPITEESGKYKTPLQLPGKWRRNFMGNRLSAQPMSGTLLRDRARIEEDALYLAAESGDVPFVIGKLPRTITLSV